MVLQRPGKDLLEYGHTVLRRLNKFEYRNTISDLLGLNTESWNPAAFSC